MSDTANLDELLGGADLDAEAVSAMQLTADTMGPAIQAGFGDVELDDIETAEVLIIKKVVDDSTSIAAANNTGHVIDGVNLVDEAVKGSKQAASVLTGCDFLNHGTLYPYVQLEDAPPLDASNYRPSGTTPLYDKVAASLTGLAAKMAEFEDGGVPARAITVIVTDGADVGSLHHNPADVCKMVEAMLRSEKHIIAAIGIDDGGYTDFRQVFKEMGLSNEWILTPGNTPSEIRKAFAVVSQSAVRASQAAGGVGFSQVALGGFGAQN